MQRITVAADPDLSSELQAVFMRSLKRDSGRGGGGMQDGPATGPILRADDIAEEDRHLRERFWFNFPATPKRLDHVRREHIFQNALLLGARLQLRKVEGAALLLSDSGVEGGGALQLNGPRVKRGADFAEGGPPRRITDPGESAKCSREHSHKDSADIKCRLVPAQGLGEQRTLLLLLPPWPRGQSIVTARTSSRLRGC